MESKIFYNVYATHFLAWNTLSAPWKDYPKFLVDIYAIYTVAVNQ